MPVTRNALSREGITQYMIDSAVEKMVERLNRNRFDRSSIEEGKRIYERHLTEQSKKQKYRVGADF